jgi:fimbrial isopeptide formation D2 family protein
VQDASVSAIQVTADLTATSNANATARTLAIDFGGHTVNFGKYYIGMQDKTDLTIANIVYVKSSPGLAGNNWDGATNTGIVSGASGRDVYGQVTFTGSIKSGSANKGALATPLRGKIVFDDAQVDIANGSDNGIAMNAMSMTITGGSTVTSAYPHLFTNIYNNNATNDSQAKYSPEFIVNDGSHLTSHITNSPDKNGGWMLMFGYHDTNVKISGSGTTVDLYDDANISGTNKDGMISFNNNASKSILTIDGGAVVNIKSKRATIFSMGNDGGGFDISGAGTEMNLTQEGEDYGIPSDYATSTVGTHIGNSTIRFSSTGNFIFDISDHAKLNIKKESGQSAAIRMQGGGNKISVTSGADFIVENVGSGMNLDSGLSSDGTADYDRNQAILFTGSGSAGAAGDFTLSGEDANVQITADRGAALANPFGTLNVNSSDFTFFVLRGHTGYAKAANSPTQNGGIMSAQSVKFTMGTDNPVSYFDFRNDGGRLINTTTTTSPDPSSFNTGKTNLALWKLGTNLDSDADSDIYHNVGFTLSGKNLATFDSSKTVADSASERTRFNSDMSASMSYQGTSYTTLSKYSRMSAINRPAEADEIRTPTDADKFVYVHAGFPRGKYDELVPADDGEVTLGIKVTDASGNTIYTGTEDTGTYDIYGDTDQQGWARFAIGHLLEKGDVVTVTSAAIHDATHGPDTIEVTASPKTVVDVTPPTPAQLDSNAIVKTVSGGQTSISGEGTPGSTVIINHGGTDTSYTGTVGTDGKFSIPVSTDSWAVGDKIYVRLQDSAGAATGVDNPPATNNTTGNINPLADLPYHDTIFPAASMLVVVDAQPVNVNFMSEDGNTRYGGKTLTGQSGDTWDAASARERYVKDDAGNWYEYDPNRTDASGTVTPFTATQLDTSTNTTVPYSQENGQFSRQYGYTVNYYYQKIGTTSDLTLNKQVKLATDDDSHYASDIDDVAPGTTLTFKLTYRNFSSMSQPVIEDQLQSGMTYAGNLSATTDGGVSVQPTTVPTIGDSSIGLTLPSGMATGATVTITFNVLVSSDVADQMQSGDGTLQLQNTATVNDNINPSATPINSNTVDINVLGKSTITVRYIDRSSDMTKPTTVADEVTEVGPIGQALSSVAGQSGLTPKTVDGWTAVDVTTDSDLTNGNYTFASPSDPNFTSTDQTITYRYERAMLGIQPDATMEFGEYRPDATDRNYFYHNGATSIAPFGVDIKDYYGVANWNLNVQQDYQFNTVDPTSGQSGHELTDAQLRFSNASVEKGDADTNTPVSDASAYFTVNQGFNLTPGASQTTVLSRINKAALLATIKADNLNDADTQWQENWRYEFGNKDTASSSVKLHVPASTKRFEDEYTSELTWNIEVTP